MAKRKSAKKQTPAVHVRREKGVGLSGDPFDYVHVPVTPMGRHMNETIAICHRLFRRVTGIELEPSEVAKVRITGEKIEGSPTK